jgi:hypothetical protein
MVVVMMHDDGGNDGSGDGGCDDVIVVTTVNWSETDFHIFVRGGWINIWGVLLLALAGA